MTIGQVADRLGISVHALRLYEREGLLAGPIRRGNKGWRTYSVDDVEWLEVCLILRGSGMPLPKIRRYTELVHRGPGTEAERRDLLVGHRTQVLDQIRELQRSLDMINYKIGVYDDILDGGLDECTTAPTRS